MPCGASRPMPGQCPKPHSLESSPDTQYDGHMEPVTLRAHFDGEHIQLDEPFPLSANAPLLVYVLPDPDLDDLAASRALASAAFARAYGDDEPEYTADDLLR